VRAYLNELLRRVPPKMYHTLTWDQGPKMSKNADFGMDLGSYFAEPHHPWLRGSKFSDIALRSLVGGTYLSLHSGVEPDAVS
jgi:hypothetical protein